MIKSILLGTLLVLAGCSTKPVAMLDYYLLDSAQSSAEQTQQTQSNFTVAVQDIVVADYLTQANLAIQLASHQLYYSKQHLWAEPLQKGIQKALLNDLNSHASQTAFVANRSALAQSPDINLGVQIDHFVATHDSTVVLSGYYWLTHTADGEKHKQVQHFHFSKLLEQDGFPHSVSQLRALINELSDDIVSSVTPFKSK